MIRTVGLVGAGSVGSSLLYEMFAVDPDNVYVVAKGDRAARMEAKGITVNNNNFRPRVYSSREQNVHLDLLIVAVKTYSLDTVMDEIADLIDSDTIILPIQNGITATERLSEKFPDNRVFYGIVLRTDAHRMGNSVFFNTLGEMQIGYADNTKIAPEVQEVHDRLKELGVNVNIYEDMRRVQWRKWMLNIGASQAAAETHVECGFFGQVEEIQEIMKLCMDEVLEIAKAENVNVGEADRDDIINILVHFPPDKKMSMLQDLEAGRPIEIDDYAGTVIELGQKHGIPTPANRMMYLEIIARDKINKIRKA